MCKVSKNLKLCTCDTDIEHLQHYWVVHRLKEIGEEEEVVIGITVMPVELDSEITIRNEALLLNLLNETEVFDTPIQFNENDRLQLSFLLDSGDYLDYGFEFFNNHWDIIEYDSLLWVWRHKEKESGKIENALEH
ncbi:hypothetical protein FNB79_15280 [Formosa sediminum]|uniref:Uncharacterized protein n=1 Tax=Formosa sediminum TaxID=2594004 RepID=A0A516GUV5_9FLAO|nr:hypothetical protein [Formosa sediminum]QDO95275.1 hypothetical protein FNB79_15280 [Formosa sediminum]